MSDFANRILEMHDANVKIYMQAHGIETKETEKSYDEVIEYFSSALDAAARSQGHLTATMVLAKFFHDWANLMLKRDENFPIDQVVALAEERGLGWNPKM